MNQLLYIVWNPDLVAFRLGPLSVRWYGLMWAIGIALAFLVVKRLYKEQKIKASPHTEVPSALSLPCGSMSAKPNSASGACWTT